MHYYDEAGVCKQHPPSSREFVLVSYKMLCQTSSVASYQIWLHKSTVLFSCSRTDKSQVADTYRVGLALLGRPEVEPYLIELGNRCVEAWSNPENAKKYKNYQWPGNVSNMKQYVHRFLAGIRNSPPRIIIDSSVAVFASTVKDVNSSYTGNLENFLPQALVHFEIHGKVCDFAKAGSLRGTRIPC